jgi:hypothetical protein
VKNAALLAILALGLLAGIAARPAQEEWIVVLSGDTDGTLAPCGCTSPMSGGLQRLATALREGNHQILIDNGGVVGGINRQDEIKAQTAAEAMDLLKIDAVNLTVQDARLGRGGALALTQLSKGRFVSSSLREGKSLPIEPWREAGPFLIGGAVAHPEQLKQRLQEEVLTSIQAARRLASESDRLGLAPILLFDGDRTAARALALAEPRLRLITYRATGSPPGNLEKVGDCALATPGEHGKTIARLAWQGSQFVAASIRSLGPDVKDDKEATILYRAYLKRVTAERLLEKVSRTPSKPFSGSEKCGSCHASAAAVWRKSGHVHALTTLERVGHGRDPECVPCHVVGLTKTTGFRSKTLTPQLSNVGCESCHGAGAAHSASPFKVRMSKVGRNSCISCHSLDNSPNFDFARYWPKVAHSLDPHRKIQRSR